MLYLRPSSIPKSGLGLYTDTDIKKGEDVVEYRGIIRTWKECEALNEAGKGGYFFFINNRYCIDAYPTTTEMGRYANDARGHSRLTGARNNSEYVVRNKKVYIVATRNIKAGMEILVSYGTDYWKYLNK
jgi:SET domain-containing protein